MECCGNTQTASSSARRGRLGACNSPDESPEPSFEIATRRTSNGGGDYDERPPTPTPEGFEYIVQAESKVPLNFCSVQNSPRAKPKASRAIREQVVPAKIRGTAAVDTFDRSPPLIDAQKPSQSAQKD